MMTRTIKTILSALLLLPLGLFAQGVNDAILNSQILYEGTSRSMAMGNATGAVGGDITATCINPAGMGLYRSQEFTFTTGLQHALVNSNYYGNRQNDGQLRMTIPSMGFVFAPQFSNYEAVRYIQFGLGFTRTNDFNYNSLARGLNPNNSMVDAFLQTVNGIDNLFDPSTNVSDYLNDNYPYDLSPAWETFLFDQYTDSLGQIYYDSPVPPGNVNQQNGVTSRGRSEEWTLALSTNLHDRFFFGASLGLAHSKRKSIRKYTETPGNEKDPNNLFDTWDYTEELNDTAWGVNCKVGIIFYPTNWLRIGAAWHSRTRYTFGETWATEISTSLKDSPDGEYYHRHLSPLFYQTYDYRTPHTFIGSLAFIIGQRGLVSADVEYMNYGSSVFTSYEYSFEDLNNEIKEILKPTCNIRIGTEWKMREFFLRCGAAYYGSPYGFGKNYGSVKKFALGLGYASSPTTSWDFAYELTECTTGYSPYSYFEDGQNVTGEVVQRLWRNKLMITLKFRIN